VLADGAEAPAARHGLVEHFNTATFRAAQGWVALQEGRPRRAIDRFRRAVELVRRRGMRVEVAELLTALAQAEERLRRHPAAAAHRGEARQVLASCPDPRYVWADPRTAEPAPPQHDGVQLTRRQAEILTLLAEALTTAEIGERLELPADGGGAPADALPQDRRALPHRGRALRGRAWVDRRSSRSVIIAPAEGTRRQDGAVR
jgi:hypothetical protein